jgi:uncharacterized membrane protein YgdD (TMEM256/DUF423 family)
LSGQGLKTKFVKTTAMERKILITAALVAVVAIALGAFGAHALKERLDVQQLATFETGVRYQMYHALFLLFVGSTSVIGAVAKKRIFYATMIGILLFSVSIYVLATQSITGINFRPLGIVTPVGGLLLLTGWLILVRELLRIKS